MWSESPIINMHFLLIEIFYVCFSLRTHNYGIGVGRVHLICIPLPTIHIRRTNLKSKYLYKIYILDLFSKIPWIILGAFIAAISLEVILIPYGLIDGGITGVSMMLSETLGLSLGALLFILNIPFIFLGYIHLGKRFAFSTMLGIIALTISTKILEVFPPFLFGNSILLIFIGAVLLGLGIGIVIRNGGALDGTDVLAILIAHRTSYSVGQSIFIINIFIFILAFLLFGLTGAIISIISYFIATIVVDMVRTK